MESKRTKENNKPSLITYLKEFKFYVIGVVILSLLINVLGLILPKINSAAIDSLATGNYNRDDFILVFASIASIILILGLLQSVLSNITSEKIAAELRSQIIAKVSRQSFSFVKDVTPSKILTNLTSDTDAVKVFINQGLVVAFSAVVQLIGSAILLLTINWRLAIPVMLTIPVLAVAMGLIFKSIQKYFSQIQAVIDSLNKVINESIVGSSLIRVLNAGSYEEKKFDVVNNKAKDIGTKITVGFATLLPVINLVVNAAFLIVLGYGGYQIIEGTLSVGEFSAFFSYIFIFIGPIILIGFLSSNIGRAFATYKRIREVIDSIEPLDEGTEIKNITGNIELKNVTLDLDNKRILDNISFNIKSRTKVAIIGPTAAGKTQIFYLITGLITQNSGEILIDGTKISDYDRNNLYSQMGIVFQDSIIFNTTIRENIAFRNTSDPQEGEITEEMIWKAIDTAELRGFIDALPDKLETVITERGSSLSGGQRQRLTLARALALNPKILLLDDFTARVDISTEKKILENLRINYPEITILAITQKINSIKEFDNIILLMEGELVAQGTHKELLEKSLEYNQIYNSQKSTEN